MADTIQKSKMDMFMKEPETRAALDMLSIGYNFPVETIVTYLAEEVITINIAPDILVADFNMSREKADELVDKISEFIIEPYQVYDPDYETEIVDEDESVSEELESEEELEQLDDESEGQTEEKEEQSEEEKWQAIIKPGYLQMKQTDLVRQTGGDLQKIINKLWDNIGLQNVEQALVIMTYLARQNKLFESWQEDRRLHGIWRNYLSEKYSETVAQKIISQEISPGSLATILRLVFVDKLDLDDDIGAMMAVVVIDNLPMSIKPRYLQISYFNEVNKEFEWSDMSLDGDEIKLEV